MFTTTIEPDHRRQLRDSIADFLARSVSTDAIRRDIASEHGFSQARWTEVAALGWTSLLLPDAFDGLDMQHADLAALHTEIGRGPLPEPLAIVPLLVGQTLALSGANKLAARVLPELVESELLATLGWQSAMGAMGAGDVTAQATRTPSGWALSGTLSFVPCVTAASAMVAAARVGSGVALFWLENMPPIVDILRQADGSVQGTVSLDGVTTDEEGLIAGPETGGDILNTVLDTARLAASAELLGIMERALEMTLDHLRQREQFGRPIGSFQALQHRAVNLYIQIELARSAVIRATDAFDSGADTTTRAAQVSAAKSRCGDGARKVVKECIQMHGAIGYTAEYDLSLFVNRALTLSAWLGNSRQHRIRWSSFQTTAGDTA